MFLNVPGCSMFRVLSTAFFFFNSRNQVSYFCNSVNTAERARKDAVQGLGNTNISIAAFKVKSRLNRSVPLFVRHEWQLCSTD